MEITHLEYSMDNLIYNQPEEWDDNEWFPDNSI